MSVARLLFFATLVAAGTLTVPLSSGARTRHKPPQPAPTTGLKTVEFGVRPPDFTYDDGGGPELMSASYGRPIVINFWATWCHPCRDELQAFENLAHDYAGRATLITLSAEDTGVARAFLTKSDVALPVAEDPQRKVFDAYSIGPIPVTIVLDPNGAVSHVAVGELDWSELKGAVDASLAREATPTPVVSASP